MDVLNIHLTYFTFMSDFEKLSKNIDVISCNKKDFEKLCKDFENLSQPELDKHLASYYKDLLEPLATIYNDREKPKFTLATSAMVAASIDGQFTMGEFRQISSLLEICTGRTLNYDEAKQMVEDATSNEGSARGFVEKTYDMLRNMNEECGAKYIMFLTGIICADGDASRSERKWIHGLLKK